MAGLWNLIKEVTINYSHMATQALRGLILKLSLHLISVAKYVQKGLCSQTCKECKSGLRLITKTFSGFQART